MDATELSKLEQRVAQLEQRIAWLTDRAELENLMAKHNLYVSTGQGRCVVPELWSKSDEASIEYGASGVYQNLWKVATFYVCEEIPGSMRTFAATNPFLRICEDGKSAHGVWIAFGTETDAGDLGACAPKEDDQRRVLLSSETPDGKCYRAEYLMQKHEVDFVKDADGWRILHLHVSEFFRCPFGSDWVRYAKERMVTDGMWLEGLFESPDPLPFFENLPSGSTTYHWQYTTEAIPALQMDLKD